MDIWIGGWMDDGCVQVRRWRYTNDCKVKEKERKLRLSEEMEGLVGCGYSFFLCRSLLQLREHHTTDMHGTTMQWRQRYEKNERRGEEDERERKKSGQKCRIVNRREQRRGGTPTFVTSK